MPDKALSSTSESEFDMNFQQLKPSCCDVFVWIGVWTDKVRFWVLSSNEAECSANYSNKQHRGNTGEGQLWLKESNITLFSKYEVESENLLAKIIEKGGAVAR